MDVKSGRRKQMRLELDRDIYKSFELGGTEFIGAKLVDLSYSGIGIMFEDGVSGLLNDQKIEFSLKFDDVKVPITGHVRHSGSKFVGIEFLKIHENKNKYFEYLDSRIIKKFQIPSDAKIRGLIMKKVDFKILLLVILIEAVLFLTGFYLYQTYKDGEKSLKYLEGYFKIEQKNSNG